MWDAFDSDGMTLAHAAAAIGCADVLAQLLALGADVTRASRLFGIEGTPLDIARDEIKETHWGGQGNVPDLSMCVRLLERRSLA